MKKLLFTLLTVISTTAFSQYTETESSFSKTFTQLRTYERPEGAEDWIYSGGDFVIWTLSLNVDFFACPGCRTQRGVMMANAAGESKFFLSYLGQLREGEDSYGDYNAYYVDILSYEEGKWDVWDSGEFRYYGNFAMLYVHNPSTFRFDYFNIKD